MAQNGGKNSQKVLWVCNRVSDAAKDYESARERFPQARILLYHSRFRYRDRVTLQEHVIEEFRYADKQKSRRKHERPAIAITTQVCEMSLDISADLLVTACCPLPSLVQRLGRLNRYADKNDPWSAFIYEFAGRPYDEKDARKHVESALRMVRELAGKPCSQKMLAEYIDDLQSSEDLPNYSAWLDGGWESEPLPLRDGDSSITVIREADLSELPSKPCAKDVIPLTIPMLIKRGFTWTQRVAGYPVAGGLNRIDYDWDEDTEQGKGASWNQDACFMV